MIVCVLVVKENPNTSEIFCILTYQTNGCSVSRVHDLRTGSLCLDSQLSPFFQRIDDSHFDSQNLFLFTAEHGFNDVNVGKQPVAYKKFCVEY